MRRLTRSIALILAICAGSLLQGASGQSVLNPLDTVATYDSTRKPSQPTWGQIGKWVRTKKMWWNTENYKAYIYKGMPFRLIFPKSYNPTAADGKKYPLMLFFHGGGEVGPIYDNEFQLLLGHQFFENSIKGGTYDGYVLSIQSEGGFGTGQFNNLREIIEYMIVNNKLDPFHIVTNGLSFGGQGAWEMLINHPTYISAALPQSWNSIMYKDPAVIEKVKYSRIWMFQGGRDGNPAPYTTYQVRDAFIAAGGFFRVTEYPTLDHGTWDASWADPEFFSFINKAYSSNPWPSGGIFDFDPGVPFSTVLGVAPGFSAYQWRKDGVLIDTADGNTIVATELGTYDARVQRNGIWSEWSRTPVTLKTKTYTTLPARVEAENWSGLPNGVLTEPTWDGGGQNVSWIDYGDWTDYNVIVPTAGIYTVQFRVASPNTTGAKVDLRNLSGTTLASVNVPNTGGWQTWQTVSTTVNLPAGKQTLRVITTDGRWNFNWLEFTSGGTLNKVPTANAGTDKSITLPTSSVALTGSGTDTDGTITGYSWSQVSGPSTATFSNANTANPTASNLVAGTYTFQLKVTDNSGGTATDDVVVVVNPQPTTPGSYVTIPARIEAERYANMFGIQLESTWDAGGGQNVAWIDYGDWMDYAINAPAAGVYTLNVRSASPNNGTQFQLRTASGTVLATVNVPNTGGFQTWQTVTTTVSLPAGQQVLRLVSTGSMWNVNWLEFVTSGGTVNKAPTANAGTDKTVVLPTNSVTLTGSGTDTDGTIASYSWSKVSGPASGTIGTPTQAQTTVSGLVQGSYTFRLTVTDNQGAIATDEVVVNVNAAPGSYVAIPAKIEAENWTTMFGVQTENTADAGGGLDVGWIDYGDWMDYNISVPTAGTYTVRFRVATPNSNSQFQIKTGTGTLLKTLSVPNTGGFQTWQTFSTTLSLAAGQQTIRIVSTGSYWNVNWLEFVSGTVAATGLGSNATVSLDPQVAAVPGPQAASIAVYPNVITDQFTLQLGNQYTGPVRVQVVSMNGAVQKEFVLNKTNAGSQRYSLSLINVPRGQYVLTLQMKGWKETRKIIKQ